MPSFISRFVRFVLRLVFWLFATVFALCLLFVALFFVAIGLLRALITGQKPKPAMVFGRFQRYSPQNMWPGAGMPGAERQGEADIVDVETREIREDKRLP